MDDSSGLFTYIIIALTSVISLAGFRDPGLVERLIFAPELILGRRQGYRLFTSSLLHADWRHLLFNMFSLYSFGIGLERHFGARLLLPVYFAGVLGGNLLALIIHRHHHYRAFGASGGVCGVIFAHIQLIRGEIGLVFFPLWVPSWFYALGFLFISFYGLRRGRDNIGHDAHLGGALIGLWTAAGLQPALAAARPWLFASVTGLGVAMFICLIKHPLWLPQDSYPSGLVPRRRPPPRRLTPEQELRQVNAILDKISRSGMNSLTAEEQRILRAASRRNR